MKRHILRSSGVLFLCAGIVVIIITLSLHDSYKSKMDDLLKNRVVVNKNEDGNSIRDGTGDLVESTLEDFSIEGIEEDQVIGEITKGTPIISIPKLNITVPVINGTDAYSLKLGAGKFEHSVDMGEVGNFAVAGHSSTIYNCIFNNLESIKLLDVIECYNEDGVLFKYYVTDTFKVDPDNVAVTYSSTDTRMTIVTCTDNGVRRFIVSAKLMSDEELDSYKKNLRTSLVNDVIALSDKSLVLDISSYIADNISLTKIPYVINYCNSVEIKPFFTNYILYKDKLNTNKHELDTIFNQTLGFDFKYFLDGGG